MLFILHPATMRNFLHHLVFAVEPRIRSKRPAARAAWLCRRFRRSGDRLDHHFFPLSNEALPMLLVSLPFVVWMGWLRAKQK